VFENPEVRGRLGEQPTVEPAVRDPDVLRPSLAPLVLEPQQVESDPAVKPPAVELDPVIAAGTVPGVATVRSAQQLAPYLRHGAPRPADNAAPLAASASAKKIPGSVVHEIRLLGV